MVALMITVQKNAIIARPAQAIWAILDHPVRGSNLNPNLKLLYCYEAKVGGYDRVFRYCMGGKTFEAGSRIIAYDAPRHMAYTTCGGLESRWHWWLESDGRQTHVALTMEYSLPKSLAALESCAVEQDNARVIEIHLANLKQVAEEAV